MNDANYSLLHLEINPKNIVYCELEKIYFDKAANLIIKSFIFPKLLPLKFIHYLFTKDFNKRRDNTNYLDICAILDDQIISVMRANYSKNIWTINTNCVDPIYSRKIPLLWVKTMLFLAGELLKKSNCAVVSFSANQSAIARIGIKYAEKSGMTIISVIPSKKSDGTKYYYKISKIINHV